MNECSYLSTKVGIEEEESSNLSILEKPEFGEFELLLLLSILFPVHEVAKQRNTHFALYV
jgi:hypothetical protein